MKSLSAVALFFGLLFVVVGQSSQTKAAAPLEVIVDVDVNDEVWLRKHKMTEVDVTNSGHAA